MRRPNTLFVGQALIDLPQVASTNAYAQELLSKTKPAEGTVISTFHQSDGRGQIGSKWESEPDKNISLSLVLYPDFLAAKDQFQLNIFVSLAVFDFVKNCLPERPVSIKWPNDIYVGDKKNAGILIQNSLINTQIRSTVVGIGININQTAFVTKPPNPTSLRLESGLNFELTDLVPALCEFLESRYLQLKAGKIVPLQQAYLRQLYRFGIPAKYKRTNGESFEGNIVGIDDIGRLKMEVESRPEVFDLKELRYEV
ncbi:MAG: biotin--[acetyl-CoA-carboxylase] ligase [Saprospiraceae bacterium]|nr:biotin--[acetyl-CoA-carboxylase] ligase [Saprospiraceae bacterium]MCF8251249.1 biotin--[acetyl-CoA-carboxylase] ligase [Saprospiraceae bacterium]MCF8282984.1 biotin--[acetyl-CoA-carboxylase] ligase [Bacteroidales bacterium]MCF8313127.1 biotin--[acetyl-CoA-carboxylase] ligase [Saprospiraceae bacterium]MCF8441611.1 biotin--[acetyl-CoA-carboxylase] ligase [Saprospiraceae bacterium]